MARIICGWLQKKRATPLEVARFDESAGAPPLAHEECAERERLRKHDSDEVIEHWRHRAITAEQSLDEWVLRACQGECENVHLRAERDAYAAELAVVRGSRR